MRQCVYQEFDVPCERPVRFLVSVGRSEYGSCAEDLDVVVANANASGLHPKVTDLVPRRTPQFGDRGYTFGRGEQGQDAQDGQWDGVTLEERY